MSTRAKSRTSPAETWLMFGAGLIAVLVTLPILTIFLLSFASSENIWPHLLGTVLPGYVWRTLGLMVGVGLLTFIIGTATAWLVSLHDFPLRRILQWACLMPLAMPTYIVSYTYVDFLNYAGALQTWLRGAMGWTRPEDYVFPEDVWVRAIEIRPGNRAVVHHILAFARPADQMNLDEDGGGARGFLVGYVPGMLSMAYPAGMAKRIPAGSQLLFQVHYTPIGTEQLDQSRLGIVFADNADGGERKIGLSIKAASRAKDAAEAQGFNSTNAGGATLGDKFRGKLDKLKPKDAQ